MKKLKLAKYCSKKVGPPKSANRLFQAIKTGEKGNVTITCHSVAGAETLTPEGELNSGAMAQRVQNLFKFRNFYDQMEFSLE